jgi:hypothetical protein
MPNGKFSHTLITISSIIPGILKTKKICLFKDFYKLIVTKKVFQEDFVFQ